MINKRFYKPGGPAFIDMGGEGPISEGFMQTGTKQML
jgi:hypothetical protein